MRVKILGVGNVLLGDEGVGPHVAALLAERGLPPWAEAVDCGAGGWALLDVMRGAQTVYLVDAADFGGRPGEVRRFEPSDAVSRKTLANLSLHEGDLLAILRVGREVGVAPKVIVYAVQVGRVAPGVGLTDPVERGAQEAARSIEEELRGLAASIAPSPPGV